MTHVASATSEEDVRMWFSRTNLLEVDNHEAVIEVPNRYVANWLRDNYIPLIRKSFARHLKSQPEIRFTYPAPFQAKNGQRIRRTFLPDSIACHLNASSTFKNFFLCRNNRFAYASAMEVAENPAQDYNPLYIFSKKSFGKTHLLNAVGNHVLKNNPRAKVRYLPAERFCFENAIARKNRQLTDWRNTYAGLDYLLIDNIQVFSGRMKSQNEFITIFDAFFEQNKQMVISGNDTPGHMKNLLPEFRSRLEGGLLVEIGGPDRAARMKIVQEKAREQGAEIPDDVAFFLANMTTDLKALHRHLVAIQAHASLHGMDMDISTVKLLMKKDKARNHGVDEIQIITAKYFNITINDLLSNKKKQCFSYPRQLAMYFCRKLTPLSFKEIGKAFGNKDHSTVIYAVKRIEKEKKKQKILNDINKIQQFLL